MRRGRRTELRPAPGVPVTRDTQRERAMALHRAGRLAEAERMYADLLRADPTDFDVLYLQGAIAQQRGGHERAVQLLGAALALRRTAAAHMSLGAALMALRRYPEALANFEAALALQPDLSGAMGASAAALRELGRPSEALARADAAIALRASTELYCYRGAALSDLGRLDEALASFDQALALTPECVEAHNYRGMVLQRLQRSAEALASFERALSLRPEAAELHNNRGNVLRHLQRHAEALASHDRAIALQADFAAAHNNRGLALQALARYAEAAQSYQRAATLRADFAEAYNNLGTVQCELGRPAEALASCQRALELQPAMPGVHGNLGNALRDLGRAEEALAQYELALRQTPRLAASHAHRGNALFDLKRIPEALASYDRAIELDPHHAQARFNKGLCLLLSGDFVRGLPLYEWRRQLQPAAAPTLPGAAWHGTEPLSGASVFVYADQALGDTLQFCRYATLLAERGARVVLAVQPQLRELLAALGPGIRVVAYGEQPEACDYHCALMSLPLALETTLANLPATVPYLHAEPRRIAEWQGRIGAAGCKVGIAWQGSRNRIDVGRSVALEMFAPLAGIPGVRLISLQKADTPTELPAHSPRFALEVLGAQFDSGPQAFLDSAAVMSHLDLVITSDTALAHLAGALGRPTWLALKQVPDWRWFLERTDSPWYPTMRLFRQSRRGEWGGVFAAIGAELARFAQRAP